MQDFPPSNMNEKSPVNERAPLIRSAELPSPSNSTRTWPVVCIILALLLERTAYYGILSNLALYLHDDMQFHNDLTIMCVLIFTGTAWMMSTLGGIIGDSYSGRYHAIWGSLLIYIFGAVFLEITTFRMYHRVFISLAFVFLSVGEGTFKANVAAFGAEQLLTQDAETYRRFFSWFYWAINIGSFIGYSLIAYVQVKCAFQVGYALPLGCLVLACIIFLIPSYQYTVYPLTGNVLKKVYCIIKEAIVLRKENARSNRRCPSLEEVMPIRHWLDRAMCKYGGSYLDSEVSEVKTLGRICVMFVMFIPYWVIYYQMNSTFLMQGLHMKLRFNANSNKTSQNDFNMPAAWLSLSDVMIVLFLIPFMEKVVYPWLNKKHCQMSVNKRITIGFLFAIASMIAAGIVEYERKQLIVSPPVHQYVNNRLYNASTMSIFWQVPQYALVGISEVFASVGCLEFAYQEAPESMHGFVMGLFYLVVSIGSLLGAGLYEFSSEVLSWTNLALTSEVQLGKHLDYYFYFLGGILFVMWLIFIVTSGWYEFKRNSILSKLRYSRIDGSECSSQSSSFVT